MARLGFWWKAGSGELAAVLLYSGTDWYTGPAGAMHLDVLPPEVASRMLPEEMAARQSGELRTVILGGSGMPDVPDAAWDALLEPLWWRELEHFRG